MFSKQKSKSEGQKRSSTFASGSTLVWRLVSVCIFFGFLWTIEGRAVTLGNGSDDRFAIPSDTDVSTQYGTPKAPFLPRRFTVFVWNFYKGQKKSWVSDFQSLAKTADLFVAQEVVSSDMMVNPLEASRLEWNMATSFIQKNGVRTGVGTGSLAPLVSWDWSRSKYSEPLIGTPKMSAYSTYPLETGESLLVVNIHGILANPNLVASLQEQLDQAGRAVAAHAGPVVVAGDFNTWVEPRTNALKRWAQNHRLLHVRFQNDPRRTPLDHIFIRDVNVRAGRVMAEIQGSDHLPLMVQVESRLSDQNP